jgi:threonine/homoserine/homoserine lactone efflux protein
MTLRRLEAGYDFRLFTTRTVGRSRKRWDTPMNGTHDLSSFLLASFLLWITPGPDTMFILARSIALGSRAGALSVLGISTGILIHTAFAAFGLSALLATSAVAFGLLKLAGALYLIFLGIQALRKKPHDIATPKVEAIGPLRIYRQGVTTNVLNPKIAIFFLAFLPQFVDARIDAGPVPYLLLGGIFVLGGTLWCLGVALCAAKATGAIRKNPQAMVWLERLSGCVYIGLGMNLMRAKPQPA